MNVSRVVIVVAALGLTVLACGKGGAPATPAPEPPPPPISPTWRQGRAWSNRAAQELMRQMSDRLARAAALAIEAEELYDEVAGPTRHAGS